MILFVVQRRDCEYFLPPPTRSTRNTAVGCAKRSEAGVEALPYHASVSPREIVLTHRLPTRI